MNLKTILTESILKEVAINGENLNDGYNILISNASSYVLYDYVYQQVTAYAKIKALNSGYISIENVAADKGYGPIMHDIVLMDRSPNEIICDEDLTDGSINVWKYYFSNRNDVRKTKIPATLVSNKIYNYGEEALLYSYSLTPTAWLGNLKVKSEMIIEKYKLNTLEILNKGEYFFNEKYGKYFV